MTFDDVKYYGCDKPDLRNPLNMVSIKHLVKNTEFKVFAESANDDECKVVALKVPGGNSLSRKSIDDLTLMVKDFGAKGLAYLKCDDINNIDTGIVSPLKNFLRMTLLNKLLK